MRNVRGVVVSILQIAAAVSVFFFSLYDLALLNTSIDHLHGNDFGKFYYAVAAWRLGKSLYAPTIATHTAIGDQSIEFLNLNPPHFHVFVAPFAALSLRTGEYVWTLANLLGGVVAFWLVSRELALRARFKHVLPATAAVLACGATGANLITGQFTGLLLLPIALAWKALRDGRDVTGGWWLGLLMSLKPFLALFVPALLVRRQWRAVAIAFLACIGWFVLGVAVFGLEEHMNWLRALADVRWVWGGMNGSLQALLVRAFTETPYAHPTIVAPWLVSPLWAFLSLVVIVPTLVASRRSVDHLFVVVPLASLLISPLGWIYYTWLVLPGGLALWTKRLLPVVAIGLTGSLTPYFAPLVAKNSVLLTLTVGSIYTWVNLFLWLGAVTPQRREAD